MNNKGKSTIIIITLSIAIIAAGRTGVLAETARTGLDSLIREATENNPKIKEAFHKWKAAEYKITSVKSLDDPVASYGHFGEEVQTRVGPQEQKFGLSQKIPFPGKLHLKGRAQKKEAQILKEQYEAVKNEIIKEIKFTYYDLFWADKALEINTEEKSILEKVEKVAQRKYESNLIAQQDVIKAQVELSKIIKKIFLLTQHREGLALKINKLLNKPQSTEFPAILKIDHRRFEYKLEDVLERAKNTQQELMAAKLSVEKAEYQKSLAQMDYLPDFTIGAEYIEIGGGTTTQAGDGEDAWMGMVSVNVPLWLWKQQAHIKEKKANLEAAKNNEMEIKNQLSFEAQDVYFKIKTYEDIVRLYQTALMPQANQAHEASQTSFETGRVSFLDWLDTERTYLQTRLAYYKAIADYHKSIAFLERIAGTDLTGGSDEE